jgi:hypothetical protein
MQIIEAEVARWIDIYARWRRLLSLCHHDTLVAWGQNIILGWHHDGMVAFP